MESWGARVEPSALDKSWVEVDREFAAKLTTEHSRTFEIAAIDTPEGAESFTADVPNVGEEALSSLDERGLIRIGSAVSPGDLLVGKVTPRGAGLHSPEEKLLRAIFGEAMGDVRDSSLRAPPGCFGVVRAAAIDGRQARVTVAWTRPLEVGDVLDISGEAAAVVSIRSLGADIAWSVGRSSAAIRKIAIARDTMHARCIGPYDSVTQQPPDERDRMGGQRLEESQVEALAANAPWTLWELMTIKSDSVLGRTRAYESLVKRENLVVETAPPSPPAAPAVRQGGMKDIFSFFEPVKRDDTPASIAILQAHLRALGFDVRFDGEISVSLLRADQIREHSHGKVGSIAELTSQKIFGPTQDYRCECGKYARMKHRGVVCEACGVEVIRSSVRRERFGHIDLKTPCAHPLFEAEVAMLGSVDALARIDLDAIEATEAGPRADLAAALMEAEIPATALVIEAVGVLPPDVRSDQPYHRLFETERAVQELFDTLIDPRWHSAVFTKTVDFSGIAHLIADPAIERGWCRVPRSIVTELFKPQAFGILEERGYVTTIKSAKKMVEKDRPEAREAIEEASDGHPLLLAAGPNLVARSCRIWEEPAIAVDPETARLLGSRTVVVHVPLTDQAALECSKMIDLPRPSWTSSKSWLSRATSRSELLERVRRAALSREREPIDPILSAALGRPPSMPDPEALKAWREGREAHRRTVRTALDANKPQLAPPERNAWLDRSVDELELSVASANALANMGVRTIGELCRRTESDVLKSRGVGRHVLKELKEILAEMGLSLGMRDV